MNQVYSHHKNQVSTLAMIHSLQMWPFQTSLRQLLYEIFSNLLVRICIHSNNILHIYVAVYFPGRVAAISTYHVHGVEHH